MTSGCCFAASSGGWAWCGTIAGEPHGHQELHRCHSQAVQTMPQLAAACGGWETVCVISPDDICPPGLQSMDCLPPAPDANCRDRRAAAGLIGTEIGTSSPKLQQQQQGQAGPACLYNGFTASNRPASPLAGINRLLQQQPHLRSPCSAAGMLRQEQDGKQMAACVVAAWRQMVADRAQTTAVQSVLTWHHIQHVQAAVWNKWRLGFEQRNPHHKLMSLVYNSRRRSTLRHVGCVLQGCWFFVSSRKLHHWPAAASFSTVIELA